MVDNVTDKLKVAPTILGERGKEGVNVTFLGTWPTFFFSFLPVMYLYDHMILTHMTAYLYNRTILSGTSLFPPFVRFLLFSPYGSL